MAGDEPDRELFAEIRKAVAKADPGVPVLLNTGATPENITDYFALGADGVIVGSVLKENGVTWNRVDPERARRFVKAAGSS